MTEQELAKAYRPADVEGAIYERWIAADVFAPDGTGSRADASKPPFVIIQPPPNITGALHLGHALTSTGYTGGWEAVFRSHQNLGLAARAPLTAKIVKGIPFLARKPSARSQDA